MVHQGGREGASEADLCYLLLLVLLCCTEISRKEEEKGSEEAVNVCARADLSKFLPAGK